jgi:hypothetical protein
MTKKRQTFDPDTDTVDTEAPRRDSLEQGSHGERHKFSDT